MYYSIPGTLFHIYKERFFPTAHSDRKKIRKQEVAPKAAATGRRKNDAESSAALRRNTRVAV